MNKKWDAELYRKTSGQQTQTALTVLEKIKFEGDERVLDIGCGDGRVTMHIAKNLVPEGSVLGIDASAEMIKLAKASFPKKKFPNLNFKRLPIEKLKLRKQFDIIVSFNALHWVKEQLQALKNIHQALVSKGRVFIIIHPRVEHVWGPMERISASDKWQKYFKNFYQPHQFYDIDGYEILVKLSGLIIDSIKIYSRFLKFPSRKDYIDALKSFAPYHERIPEDKREEFLEDVAAEFEKFTARDAEGNLLCPVRTLEVFAHRE